MTLAQARRQVWTRRLLGGLLVVLAVLFLLLALVKHLYHTPAGLLFPAVGPALRRHIDPILRDSAVLSLLWRLIPTWQLPSAAAATPAWDYLSIVWGAMVVIVVGAALLNSARARHTQIRQMYEELAREAWKRDVLGHVERPQELEMRVIHQLLAPPEPWHKTLWGIVILGLVVAVVGRVLGHLAETLLFANAR
jgi:hypothetical protein